MAADNINDLLLAVGLAAGMLVLVGFMAVRNWQQSRRLLRCEASLRVHIDACARVGRQLTELEHQQLSLRQQVDSQLQSKPVEDPMLREEFRISQIQKRALEQNPALPEKARAPVKPRAPAKPGSIESKLVHLLQTKRGAALSAQVAAE